MRSRLKRRLDAIESVATDWAAKLHVVDYGIFNYAGDEWEEVHFDSTVTVVQHKETKEVRGYYRDRRTDDELIQMGGDLSFL